MSIISQALSDWQAKHDWLNVCSPEQFTGATKENYLTPNGELISITKNKDGGIETVLKVNSFTCGKHEAVMNVEG